MTWCSHVGGGRVRIPSARATEAAAAEEDYRAYKTEMDKRFQDAQTKFDTKFEATDGAIAALDGVVQGHIAKTGSQVTSLQEETKNLKETTESLQEMFKNLQGKMTEVQAVQARQSRGRSASANMLSPNVERPFKMPKFTEQKTRASTGVA